MSSNAQKTPFGQSLNRFATATADKAIALLGKSLPASVVKIMGAIFQVRFEIEGTNTIPDVTIPSLGSRYVRLPIQPGEKGVTLGCDAYLGGMSGLGGGTAGLTAPANLTALAWTPIGSTAWPSVDPNTLVLTGASGGILHRDSESPGSTISMTGSAISMACGGHTIVINSTGVIIDGKVFLTHEHTNVQPGGGNSGPVL